MSRNTIQEAADIFFPEDGTRTTLNLKFGTPARGIPVTAEALAHSLVHAEGEIRAGRARRIDAVD